MRRLNPAGNLSVARFSGPFFSNELSLDRPIGKRHLDCHPGQLELELPHTTFDTWLKETEGIAFDGMDLLVQVPSVFTIAWLEQRMYHTILRALRQSSGELLDVRFQVSAEVAGELAGGKFNRRRLMVAGIATATGRATEGEPGLRPWQHRQKRRRRPPG